MGLSERSRAAALLFFLAITFSSACAPRDDAKDDTVADTAAAAEPAAPAPLLSDAEIAHIAVTANTIDADAGEMAKGKAENAEVRTFAEAMVRDHTGVNQQAYALAQRLSLTPADNPTSQQMNSEAQRAKQYLEGKSGGDFDRSYMTQELLFHQQVLNVIDNSLIPNAQNAELKAFLEQVRPAIAAHLQRAEQIQATLMK